MYREILFRGKQENNNEWVEGYYWSNGLGNYFIKVIQDKENRFVTDDIEIVTEISQYTGVKDKENNKIFEEDIVTDGVVTYVVSYGRGGFVLTGVNKSVCYSLTELTVDELESLKIIGNRFDNPELLD